jgi:hypothetical protein
MKEAANRSGFDRFLCKAVRYGAEFSLAQRVCCRIDLIVA